jgi:hypothetical protein
MTTLELTTLAYILCALVTLYIWRHKPMDVRAPIVVECSTPMSWIAARWKPSAMTSYYYTPLDFVSREEWSVTRLWTYYVNLLRGMRLVRASSRTLPVQRFSTFNFPSLSRSALLVLLNISFSYMAIFVAGWNFHFPTKAEQLLWRICTLGTLCISIFAGGIEVAMLLLQQRSRHAVSVLVPRGPRPSIEQTTQGSRFQVLLQNFRNNTPEKDPQFDVPIRSLLITTPMCALYCIFRAFILAEDLASLRELPGSAFAAIDWSTYVPHL